MTKIHQRYPEIPYVVPFVVFMIFTALTPQWEGGVIWLYPAKTVVVAALIFYYWPYYEKLSRLSLGDSLLAVVVGILVLVIWVAPEGVFPLLGESTSFNPYQNIAAGWVWVWIFFRMAGASLVVPVMEEIFWRNFLLRWIINVDFKKVEIGAFTWGSFVIGCVLFGLEHNRWVVGIIAGVFYTLLLYRTKSISACILAHGVTNLGLGLYVLQTESWSFW